MIGPGLVYCLIDGRLREGCWLVQHVQRTPQAASRATVRGDSLANKKGALARTEKKELEEKGIDPFTSRMLSERSTI